MCTIFVFLEIKGPQSENAIYEIFLLKYGSIFFNYSYFFIFFFLFFFGGGGGVPRGGGALNVVFMQLFKINQIRIFRSQLIGI